MTTDKHIHSVPDTPGGSFVCAGPSGRVVAPSAELPADSVRRLTGLAERHWGNFNWNDARWTAEESALESAFMFWADLLGQIPDAARLFGTLLHKVDSHPDIRLLLLDAAGYFWRHGRLRPAGHPGALPVGPRRDGIGQEPSGGHDRGVVCKACRRQVTGDTAVPGLSVRLTSGNGVKKKAGAAEPAEDDEG